jgi:hypothetical protein
MIGGLFMGFLSLKIIFSKTYKKYYSKGKNFLDFDWFV